MMRLLHPTVCARVEQAETEQQCFKNMGGRVARRHDWSPVSTPLLVTGPMPAAKLNTQVCGTAFENK
jgi:hypothetical protein